MMFIEPSPCGHFIFGSCLVRVEDRFIFLNARRDVVRIEGKELREVMEMRAESVIAELMSQASLVGLNAQQIRALVHFPPEFDDEGNAT